MCFSSEIGFGGVNLEVSGKEMGAGGKFEVTAENRLVEKIVWLLLSFGRLIGPTSCHDTDGSSDGIGICHLS